MVKHVGRTLKPIHMATRILVEVTYDGPNVNPVECADCCNSRAGAFSLLPSYEMLYGTLDHDLRAS